MSMMQWEQHITSSAFLPKRHNFILIMRKLQTNPNRKPLQNKWLILQTCRWSGKQRIQNSCSKKTQQTSTKHTENNSERCTDTNKQTQETWKTKKIWHHQRNIITLVTDSNEKEISRLVGKEFKIFFFFKSMIQKKPQRDNLTKSGKRFTIWATKSTNRNHKKELNRKYAVKNSMNEILKYNRELNRLDQIDKESLNLRISHLKLPHQRRKKSKESLQDLKGTIKWTNVLPWEFHKEKRSQKAQKIYLMKS